MHATAELYREGMGEAAREEALSGLQYATPDMIVIPGATLTHETDEAVRFSVGAGEDARRDVWFPKDQVGVALPDGMRHVAFVRRSYVFQNGLDWMLEG